MKSKNTIWSKIALPRFRPGAQGLLRAATLAAFMGPFASNAIAQCTADNSNNDNDVALNSGAACATGRNGSISNAIQFDGVDDYAVAPIGEITNDIFSNGGTVSAWIYPTGWGGGGSGRIISKGSTTTDDEVWTLTVSSWSSNGNNVFFKRKHSSQTGYWQTPNGSMTLNAWHHVAVVYDDSSLSNDPIIYIDGVAQTLTKTWTPAGTPTTDDAYPVIIGNSAALSRAFAGKIEGVSLVHLLTPEEDIIASYAQRGSWQFEEESGSTTADDTKYMSDGTINGATRVSSAVGAALQFDGVDDYVSIANHADRNNLFSGGGTISAWFYATSAGENGYGRIAGKGDAAADTAGWGLSLCTAPIRTSCSNVHSLRRLACG